MLSKLKISILLNPIIPIPTKKVLNTINITDKDILVETIKKENIIDNNKELKNLDILFKKIEMIIDYIAI